MSSSFFTVPEPIAQATQKLWQEQIAHAGRLVADSTKLEADLAERARTTIDASAMLVRHSFDYFFALSETIRTASLTALKDAAAYGSNKAAE